MQNKAGSEKKGVITALTPVQSTLVMIAILSATLGMCGDVIITPGADQMFKFYHNDSFVNFLLSGPNLVSVFASVLAGLLQRYIDKKKVLLLGMILFFAGGTFGAAIESEVFMVFMRCLVGLALGFTSVTAMSIVTNMYSDENKRSRMVGIINAGIFCSATLLAAFSGWICEVYGFRAMFYIYGIGMFSIVLILMFLPRIPADMLVAKRERQGAESGMKLWKEKLIVLCLGYFIFQVSYGVIPFFISVYAGETGLGGPAFAGKMTAALGIGALLASLCFGYVYPKLKRYSMILSMVLLIIGYLILLCKQSAVYTTAGCLLFGYANANAFLQAIMRAGIVAPAKNVSPAVSIVTAVMGFGFFVSTYTVQALKSILGVDTLMPILMVLLTMNIALVIVSFGYLVCSNKKEKAQAA